MHIIQGVCKLLLENKKGYCTHQDESSMYRKPGPQTTYSVKNLGCFTLPNSFFVHNFTSNENIVTIFSADLFCFIENVMICQDVL